MYSRLMGWAAPLKRKVVLITVIALLVAAVPSVHRAGNQEECLPDQSNKRRTLGIALSPAEQPYGLGVSDNPCDRVHLQSRLVNTTLTVTDRNGECVTGLTKNNFEVFDNGVKQQIAQLRDDDAPLTLGIIYDVSGSMKDRSNMSFQALKSLFVNSHEDDQYFLIAFKDRPALAQDFTISPLEIMNRVVSINTKGSTALYDAVYLGVEKARQGRHARKALLIISDGLDNNSLYTAPELREQVQEADVPIYCIGSRELYIGAGNLKNMCEWSGGRAFFPADRAETFDVYAQIGNMLRSQYLLGFYPTDTSSSVRRHKVRINLKTPPALGQLSLSYKKGYESFR